MNHRAECEKLVLEKWPSVVIRWDLGAGEDLGSDVMDVFMIPDAKAVDFLRFSRRELRDCCTAAGVARPIVILHTESATREYYPDLVPKAPSRGVYVKTFWGQPRQPVVPSGCNATSRRIVYVGESLAWNSGWGECVGAFANADATSIQASVVLPKVWSDLRPGACTIVQMELPYPWQPASDRWSEVGGRRDRFKFVGNESKLERLLA